MKKLIPFFLLIAIFTSNAKETAPYQQGLHYNLIDPVVEPEKKDKIIIYEFFGYRCKHCATFVPYMSSLQDKLPEYAEIKLMPVGFKPSWKVLAQGFFTAQSLGVLEKSHRGMFDALHKQHKQFRSIEDIAKWYASEYGVDKEKFLSTAQSFMIDGMVKKTNNLANKMKIRNTPTLIIDGKYIPIPKTLGSNNALVDLTLFLVEKEAKSRGLIK